MKKAATIGISGGIGLTILYFVKEHFSGGKCLVKRDLTGKVAVITGGNYGSGKQVALQLAKQNCNIIIGGRDERRTQNTIRTLRKINKNITAYGFYLQLGDRQSIQTFVDFVKAKSKKVDFLVNNAGVATLPGKSLTKDGMEMQIGFNHFGHFYLTYKLFPLLKASDQFRVINISSKAHQKITKLNFDDLHYQKSQYSGIEAYSRSKLANIYFTQHLQHLIDHSEDKNLNGISLSLHPGVIRTQIARYFSGQYKAFLYAVYPFLAIFTKNSLEGAQTTLHTILQNKDKLIPGGYYSDCQHVPIPQSQKIFQAEQAKQLWKVSEQAYKVSFTM